MKVRNYQELIVWQRAMDLVEEVYKATKEFPREELYALKARLGEPLFQSHQILLKVKEDEPRLTSFDTSQLPTGLYVRLRRKS